jgi:hypothetical protein
LADGSSLGAINFYFDISINPEGLLAFSTKDHADRLLLDLSSACSGEQYMKVETRGERWASVAYWRVRRSPRTGVLPAALDHLDVPPYCATTRTA